MILNFFQYSFLVKALIAGSLLAIITGLLGVFLVLRKLSLIGDGLSHVSFGAVALGLLLGVYPYYISLPLTVLASFLVFRLMSKAKIYGDTAIGIISAAGVSLGVIIASLAGGFNVDLFSYLFGSLLAVSMMEIYFLLILTTVTIYFIVYNYRALFALSFDESSAKTMGLKTDKLNRLILILLALTVAAAVKAVGVMLVSALLILPAASALQRTLSFKKTLLRSVFFALLSVIFGLLASIGFNLPTGASIVVAGLFIFIINYLLRS
ncbi:MAG: metal ABC transporter permease [Clostridia bacterium]|nr:metal ABC transporter permease [Clostridia bacterium]